MCVSSIRSLRRHGQGARAAVSPTFVLYADRRSGDRKRLHASDGAHCLLGELDRELHFLVCCQSKASPINLAPPHGSSRLLSRQRPIAAPPLLERFCVLLPKPLLKSILKGLRVELLNPCLKLVGIGGLAAFLRSEAID